MYFTSVHRDVHVSVRTHTRMRTPSCIPNGACREGLGTVTPNSSEHT